MVAEAHQGTNAKIWKVKQTKDIVKLKIIKSDLFIRETINFCKYSQKYPSHAWVLAIDKL